MNKLIPLTALLLMLNQNTFYAQTFSPILTSNYNFDAVAEATTALATTTGPIDGSNFVLYSAAYGALYSASGGLPNNGLISSGTRTYQLQSYTVNNMCYLPASTTDSIIFTNPSAYAGLSLLCFSTEGAGAMNVTVRFTDNTTQVYNSQFLSDWFSTGNTIISGFDRVSRSGGVPAGVSGNPKMFNLDFVIACANRSKNIQNIKFQNTGTNARNCIMAVSGASVPSFTASTNPVTCVGGTNGSASVTAIGGLTPFSYTWSTTPPQYSPFAGSLSNGVYTYTATDAGLCPLSGTVSITQTLIAEPSLTLAASASSICAGSSVTLLSIGAITYTWMTGSNGNTFTANPTISSIFTVSGHSSSNCLRTGSISITVNALPLITFTTPASLCVNAPQLQLSAIPAGGTYAGSGIVFGNFYPNLSGAGSQTMTYTYTDLNNCTSTATNTIFVNPLPTISFTVSSTPLCSNSPTLILNAMPVGGTFSGTGVNGTVYTPSLAGVGNPTVAYTFTDSNNCTAIGISNATINTVPIVSILTTKKLFCLFTASLTLNASPSGGTYSGTGVSSSGNFNPSTAGVGTHNITYSYTDANTCTGKAVISMTVSACTGMSETNLEQISLIVFPNPNNGSFTVKTDKKISLTLINQLGQVLNTYSVNESTNFELIISDLQAGIYFLVEQNNSLGVKQKIMVSN